MMRWCQSATGPMSLAPAGVPKQSTTALPPFAVGAGSDPKQLGYTYGKPNISRLANGKWVVVLPASYNSDETGDGAVGTGLSTLFILDIQTGAVIRQFNLTGSKGLTSPTMGDLQGDFVDEYAVAGDLNGQLWKFDLTSTTPSSWTVAKVFQPAVDGDQPITSAPRQSSRRSGSSR